MTNLDDDQLGIIGETVTRAFTEGYERGKASARPWPLVEIYRWVCPWCKGGTDPDSQAPTGCFHCAGQLVTNDVGGWDVTELTPAPLPAALMPAPCGDCAYRPGSPEQECAGSVKLPGAGGNPGPFFCHLGMMGDNEKGYTASAWVGELPLGAMLCRGWWDKLAGEAAPARPYRDRHAKTDEGGHRCTEACVCPACGAPMFYAHPTGGQLGEHGCADPSCLFAAGEHDAMKRWMPPDSTDRRRAPAHLPESAP